MSKKGSETVLRCPKCKKKKLAVLDGSDPGDMRVQFYCADCGHVWIGPEVFKKHLRGKGAQV